MLATRTGYIVSCNLIGSEAQPKHWLNRKRTKFQRNDLVSRDRAMESACGWDYRENQAGTKVGRDQPQGAPGQACKIQGFVWEIIFSDDRKLEITLNSH